MLALTVLHAFGDYAIGQTITDPDAVEKIQASTNAPHVVRVNLPDPEPEADAKDDKAEPTGAEVEPPKPDAKTSGKRG